MDITRLNAALRLPSAPYPGLRPFLDHEAALLLGRVRQVDEVIKRLHETQFVAVIGGSGSGKSSLVRAGVVPELRGFGIPDAGDYWVPVICTPGTTSLGEQENAAQTPITRLAWKFSQVLESTGKIDQRKPGGDGALADPALVALEDAKRRSEISKVFSQRGFATLVDIYSEELPQIGPSTENARFLFVIDQFEELFQPENRDNPDAKQLIEAVIDHFFQPHPRCYVILTMRSEHLADCASFLELPDAINKSSYLVRRLDEHELRDAIVGPAKYFLRLLQRRGPVSGTSLPDDIDYDEEVILRLLSDVEKITGDTDHLALLQHLLARIWRAARDREKLNTDMESPTRITWGDLEKACNPRSQLAPGWLREQPKSNTLSVSLENCAQSAYDELATEQQGQIDVVLRRLAFKDANTGLYSQRRLCVDDPSLFPGVAQPRDQLRALLDEPFLGNVNYLFWDDENPDNVTVKVSHEAFIRGWPHFRKLVDIESKRYAEFVAVLRKCEEWTQHQGEDFLLEPSDLLRFDEAKLEPVFLNPQESQKWFRVLLIHQDERSLGKVEAKVIQYVTRSREKRNAERRQRDRLRLMVRAGGPALLASITLLLVALSIHSVQYSLMESERKFAQARFVAEKAMPPGAYLNEVQMDEGLGKLISAAIKVGEGNQIAAALVRAAWPLGQSHPMMENAIMTNAMGSSEPMVNGTLRHMLTSGLWRSTTNEKLVPERFRIMSGQWSESCKLIRTNERKQPVTTWPAGALIFNHDAQRGIFIPQLDYADSDLHLYAATYDKGECVLGRPVWSIPSKFEPKILFDGQANYMAIAANGSMDSTVTQLRIKWGPIGNGFGLEPKVIPISVSNDANFVALVRKEIEMYWSSPVADKVLPHRRVTQVASAKSWRETNGHGMLIGGHAWQLLHDDAQLIDKPVADKDWEVLNTMRENSRCLTVVKELAPNSQDSTPSTQDVFENGDLCFLIKHGATSNGQTAGNSGKAAQDTSLASEIGETYLVSIYRVSKATEKLQKEVGVPSPIASFVAFDNFARPGKWVIGTSNKEFDGWIANRREGPNGKFEYYAARWDTKALLRAGEGIRQQYKLAAGAAPQQRDALQTAASAPQAISRASTSTQEAATVR